MRYLLVVPLLFALGGCAGDVFSGAGRSQAGSGLASSKHAQGFACPDFTAQGALQVTQMNAYCSDSPVLGHSESFSAQGLDPNQALATAFSAQVQTNAQMMDALGKLLPLLETAAGAAVGVPISPVRQPSPPPNPAAACITAGKTAIVTAAGVTCQ